MLTQSEAKLRFHLENSPLGFIEWDEHLQVKYMSGKAQEIFGWTTGEFRDHAAKGFTQVYKDDRELVKEIGAELLSGAVERNTLQHRNLTKDGRVIWCEWFNSVLKDNDGKVTSVLSLVQDITDSRLNEQKTKQLSHLYAFISQVNKDIVHVKDERTLFQNSCAIATELGYFKIAWIGLFDSGHTKINLVAQSGLLEQDIKLFTDTPFEKDGPIDMVLQTDNHFTCHDMGNDRRFAKGFIQRNAIHSCMILPVKKRGVIIGTFNFYTEGQGFTDQREIELLSGLSDDISAALERFDKAGELKQSEQRYRQIVETAQEGLWLIDEKHNTLFVNKRFTEIFGYSPEEMIGKPVFDLMDHHYRKIAKEKLVRRRKGIAEDFEMMYIAKDGQHVWANVSASPVNGDDGKYLGALSMLTNITARKKAEADKEISRRQEVLAITDAVITGEEKARQEMGRELHDNINQILATAQLYLGMSLQKNPGADTFVQKSEELIVTAIKEIRNLSHATISPFIEDDSLVEALGILSLVTEKSGSVRIRKDFAGFEEKGLSEKFKLTIFRIVQEQFQNILKYAKAQNVVLHVMRDPNGLSLTITDDGIGYDTSKKAAGIGMKNIKTRISIFHGEMHIVSSPGKGCRLQVCMKI
ncbi:MAG: PAS domain S-box protein [Bacteroidota bacterium]